MYREIEKIYLNTDLKGGMSEAFAQGLERYIEGTKSANSILNGIFEKLKALCKSILNFRKAHKVLDSENKAFFDSIFSPSERTTEEAKQKQSEVIAESESNQKMASATEKIIKTPESTVDSTAPIKKEAVINNKKKLNDHSWISADAMKKRHDIENNLESLKKAAMPDVKHMQDALSYIGKKLGLSDEFEKSDRFYFYRNGIKSDGRMVEKVKDDYDGNFKKLKDITGGTFVVREGEAKSVFEQVINSGDLDIENTKAPKSTKGYFDYKINYLLPNGTIGELIILEGYMYYMKSTIGHELYDITREITSAYEKEKKGEIKISNEQKKFLDWGYEELSKISDTIYSDKNWSFENISKALSDDIPKLLSGSVLVNGLTTKLSENLSRDKITGLESALEKANSSRSLLSSKSQTRNNLKASNSDLSNIKSSNAIVSDKVTPENTKEVASKVADAIVKKAEPKKESKTVKIEDKAQELDVRKIDQDKKKSKTGNLMDIDATRSFDNNAISRREVDFNKYIIREVDAGSPQINFIKNGFLKPSANLDKLLTVVSQLAYNGKVISNRDMDKQKTDLITAILIIKTISCLHFLSQ